MKVKLVKDHTHAGVDYPAGAVIEVDGDTADWLRAQKVAEPPVLKAVANEKGPKKEIEP